MNGSSDEIICDFLKITRETFAAYVDFMAFLRKGKVEVNLYFPIFSDILKSNALR